MDDPGDGFGDIPTFMQWFFGGVVALMLCIVVLTVVAFIRNRRVFRQAGIDPTTAGAQLAVRFIRGQPSIPPPSAKPSAASRLAELDELRNRGLITAEEYAARRAQIIDGI